MFTDQHKRLKNFSPHLAVLFLKGSKIHDICDYLYSDVVVLVVDETLLKLSTDSKQAACEESISDVQRH